MRQEMAVTQVTSPNFDSGTKLCTNGLQLPAAQEACAATIIISVQKEFLLGPLCRSQQHAQARTQGWICYN